MLYALDSTSGKNDVLRLVGLTLEEADILAEYIRGTDSATYRYHDLIIHIKDTG